MQAPRRPARSRRSSWPAGTRRATRGSRVTYLPLTPEPGNRWRSSSSRASTPRPARSTSWPTTRCSSTPATGKELGRREWGAAGDHPREPDPVPLHAALQPAHPGDGRHRPLGHLADGRDRAALDDRLLRRLLPDPAARARRRPEGPKAEQTSWWARWKPAWQVKWSGRLRRINFDLHRASGLWLWAFLFMLAVSAVSLNLYSEVAQPLVAMVADFTPSPYDLRTPKALNQPIRAARLVRDRARGRPRRGETAWVDDPGGCALVCAALWRLRGVFLRAGRRPWRRGRGPARALLRRPGRALSR